MFSNCKYKKNNNKKTKSLFRSIMSNRFKSLMGLSIEWSDSKLTELLNFSFVSCYFFFALLLQDTLDENWFFHQLFNPIRKFDIVLKSDELLESHLFFDTYCAIFIWILSFVFILSSMNIRVTIIHRNTQFCVHFSSLVTFILSIILFRVYFCALKLSLGEPYKFR